MSLKCKCGGKMYSKKRKLCRNCYRVWHYRNILKPKRAVGWLARPLTMADEKEIKMLLLRFKYFNYTAIDILKITNFYYNYKKEDSPEYENYSSDKFVAKVCKMFKNVIIG